MHFMTLTLQNLKNSHKETINFKVKRLRLKLYFTETNTLCYNKAALRSIL